MHNGSVQFFGTDNILEAYDNCKIPSWAFLQGKGIIASWVGEDQDEGRTELEMWMQMLKRSKSTAVYALQLYKSPGEDITNKTPWNNRFQCKLIEDEDAKSKWGYERIKELEAQLAEKDEEEEKIGGIQGWIVGLVEKPEVQQYLIQNAIGIVRGIGQFIKGKSQQPAAVAGVPKTAEEMNQDEANAFNNLPVDEQEKVTRAMVILMCGDPQVGTNLLKLATILQTDPGKYKLLSAMV